MLGHCAKITNFVVNIRKPMTKKDIYEDIKVLITDGKTKDAIKRLDQLIETSSPMPDYLYYLRGNAFRKQNDWPSAINNYLKAMELNPDSPASEAYKMAIDIQEFYNKDMYNQ